jgi:hypothetical protein
MELYSYWAPQQQRDLYGIRINKERELVVRARWRRSKIQAMRAFKEKSRPDPYVVDKIFTTYHGPTFGANSAEPKCTCEVLFWTQGHEKHCPWIRWKNK